MADEGPVQCEYEMTRADLFAAQRASGSANKVAPAPPQQQRADPNKMLRGLIGWILFIALSVMLFTLLNQNRRGGGTRMRVHDVEPGKRAMFWTGVSITAAGAAMFMSIFVIIRYHSRSLRPVKNGRVTVRLDDAGVAVTTAYRQDTLTWDGILDVTETDDRFVLRNVGAQSVVLPKRGFARPTDLEATRAMFAQRVVRTAQRAPA